MKSIILVAGGTGNLGEKIVHALIKRDAEVRIIARPSSDKAKIKSLEDEGVRVFFTEMTDHKGLLDAMRGVDVVVSALQGLRDVIVDTQRLLVDAAVEAGVTRFIPSDFSTDFTLIPAGDNRNFDLRREFHQYLDKAPIAYTSIFNGAFANIVTSGTPLLDLKNKTVGYWDDADRAWDATTMDNTAEFTAAAALDGSAPQKLHIAGIRVSAKELKVIAEEATGHSFELKNLGTTEELKAYTRHERKAHPEGEEQVFPMWQGMQYLLSMYTASEQSLDNERYPGIQWTDAKALLNKR